ncbi:MAG: TonB-dependent receptor plug domain-containing protein [Opitutales bacterium]
MRSLERRLRAAGLVIFLASGVLSVLSAQPDASPDATSEDAAPRLSRDPFVPNTFRLEPMAVFLPRVAIDGATTTIPTAVTALRFEPLVDLQERNAAEKQGDITIRGGIFENTGVKVGAANLFDPQTGHFFGEVPISVEMISDPIILTGVPNALAGFNSNVGTVSYAWRPIVGNRFGAHLAAGVGTDNFNFQTAYGHFLTDAPIKGVKVGVDAEYARSEGDGTQLFGDHRFDRYSGRIQVRGENFQTDFFGGYQRKFFGWPGAYTGFASLPETDSTQTTLFLANHRMNFGEEGYLEASVYYRRLKDDYEGNRFVFQAFGNDFRHETEVVSGAFIGAVPTGPILWQFAGTALWEEIDSTNLENGPFTERTLGKFALLPKIARPAFNGEISAAAGFSIDTSDRDSTKGSPLVELAYEKSDVPLRRRAYLSFAQTSQLAGYTARGAPTVGLFGGNPDLARERTDNLEVGFQLNRDLWSLQGAVFYRWDEDLADFIFSTASPNARSAQPVDTETFGFELVFRKQWKHVYTVFGYTYLTKSEDYGSAFVDASFYVLNFPRHRLTAAVIWDITSELQLRVDNEFRVQEPNALRQGTRTPFFTTLGLFYFPKWLPGAETSLTLDNVFNESFQDIPGTPGIGRQLTWAVGYRF